MHECLFRNQGRLPYRSMPLRCNQDIQEEDHHLGRQNFQAAVSVWGSGFSVQRLGLFESLD